MLQEKIRGCLIGGAIGDALGYQIEFDRGIREKQVTKFKYDFGTISDDTQMTLFTANSLLWYFTKTKTLPHIDFTKEDVVYQGYLDWLETQRGIKHDSISWIKDIETLNKTRLPGTTCISALSSGKMGSLSKPINNSKGCGSVMRIAPCGVFESNPDEAGMLAAKCGAITHGHLLSSISSYVCAAIINFMLYADISLERAVEASINLLRTHEDIFDQKPKTPFGYSTIDEFEQLINRAIYLSKEPFSDTNAIQKIGEGWVAEEALAIAIYACLKYQNNFNDAIICAANHDGDSDSTAAIAGNILGATLGINAIDSYYIDHVELHDTILEIADDMLTAKICMANGEFSISEQWNKKYIAFKF